MRLKPGKERLDKLMVIRGLVETRTKAQALILAGQVFSKEQRLEKAGLEVLVDIELTIREPLPYVSRGGLKLAAALDHFQVDVRDLLCLDIGASTGGFTDCLLQRGARRVVALDVGHGQIDWKLRQDQRVEVRENVNARYLLPDDFSERFDLVVADDDEQAGKERKVDADVEDREEVLIELEPAEYEEQEEDGVPVDGRLDDPGPEGRVQVDDVTLLAKFNRLLEIRN